MVTKNHLPSFQRTLTETQHAFSLYIAALHSTVTKPFPAATNEAFNTLERCLHLWYMAAQTSTDLFHAAQTHPSLRFRLLLPQLLHKDRTVNMGYKLSLYNCCGSVPHLPLHIVL